MATLLENLGSKVFSKFLENMGILKPILRNCDLGWFLHNILWKHKKGIYSNPAMSQLHLIKANLYLNRSICWDATHLKLACFFITYKLSLYLEFVIIYKKGEQLLFEHFSCFLKNRGILNCFDFKGSFKKLKSSWFHLYDIYSKWPLMNLLTFYLFYTY